MTWLLRALWRRVKYENSTLPVAVRGSKTLHALSSRIIIITLENFPETTTREQPTFSYKRTAYKMILESSIWSYLQHITKRLFLTEWPIFLENSRKDTSRDTALVSWTFEIVRPLVTLPLIRQKKKKKKESLQNFLLTQSIRLSLCFCGTVHLVPSLLAHRETSAWTPGPGCSKAD